MAEKGLPGVTLREVAERAGVQAALVSYYFGGKDGLLQAVIDLVAGETQELITQAALRQGNVEERLRALIEAWVIAMASDPYAPRLMTERVLFAESALIDEFVAKFAKPSLAAIRSLLDEGRERGELRDMDPMYVIPAMVGMCVHFFLGAPMFQRLFDLDEITPEHVRRFALCVGDLMTRGIAAGKVGE
jgi:AcrR family transcriptional regulator